VAEYDLPYPPEKVWRALTEPELLASWLMPNDIQPVVGHHFRFQAPPVPGWDGVVYCEVLAVEPLRRLSYSWCGGSDALEKYGHRLDTVVTWTLTPTAGSTHLRLDHDGFTPRDSFAFEAMGKGWREQVAARMAETLASL
jgi:uncharacterized protein YndB with AHSA1/START domain